MQVGFLVLAVLGALPGLALILRYLWRLVLYILGRISGRVSTLGLATRLSLAQLITVIVGVAATIVFGILALMENGLAPSPEVRETPAATATTNEVFDDFSDGTLGPIWPPPSDGGFIYEGGGVLNLKASGGTEGAGASVAPRLTERQVEEVEFTITLKSYEGEHPGGAGFGVMLDDDRVLTVDVGPGPNGPGVELSVCPSKSAGYDECDHNEKWKDYCDQNSPPSVSVGDPLPMQFHWRSQGLQFSVGGEECQYPASQGPIREVWFYIFADPGAVLHAVVDDLHLRFASD